MWEEKEKNENLKNKHQILFTKYSCSKYFCRDCEADRGSHGSLPAKAATSSRGPPKMGLNDTLLLGPGNQSGLCPTKNQPLTGGV